MMDEPTCMAYVVCCGGPGVYNLWRCRMDPDLAEWEKRYRAELEVWGRANQARVRSLELEIARLKGAPNLLYATTKEMLEEIASRLELEGILNATGRD